MSDPGSTISDDLAAVLANTRPRSDSFEADFKAAKELFMNKYTVVIVWSEEDNSFIGLCPEFPGLSAIGSTRVEAFTETEATIDTFLAICEEAGIPLPVPSSIPGYQGRVQLQWSRAAKT